MVIFHLVKRISFAGISHRQRISGCCLPGACESEISTKIASAPTSTICRDFHPPNSLGLSQDVEADIQLNFSPFTAAYRFSLVVFLDFCIVGLAGRRRDRLDAGIRQ
jgi:hypothetical protein